jgi:hypothetical protein
MATVKQATSAAQAAIAKAKEISAQQSNVEATPAPTPLRVATEATVPATKKLSPKAKESRGVDPSLVTTWVPVDNTPEFNKIMHRAAKANKTTVVDLYTKLIIEAMTPEKIAYFEAEAAKAPEPKTSSSVEGMSLEKLEKAQTSAMAKLEAVKAKLAAIKAAQAKNDTVAE